MKVSVIIPCHNSSKYLPRTLESLEKQSIGIKNLEIIIVDDASEDGGKTRNIILEFEHKWPDVVKAIFLQEHRHVGGARNVAMGYMTGEYMLNLDSDDLYHEDAIKRLVDIAITYAADAVEFCTQDIIGYEDDLLPYVDNHKAVGLIEINSEEDRKEYIVTQAISQGCCRRLYRADIIRKYNIKYPEGHTLEEPAFTMIYRMYTNRHFMLNERVHYYLRHDDGIMSTAIGSEYRKFDNADTHQMLYREFVRRGFYEGYSREIDYQYFRGYFFETLLYAVYNGYFFDVDEFAMLQNNVKTIVPNIRENEYYRKNFANIPAMDDVIECNPYTVDMESVKQLFEKIWEYL